MINLLPDTAKKEILSGRSNIILFNYITIIVLGVIFLAFICVAVYFVLVNTRASAESLISENQSRTTSYSSVQAQAASLRNSLATAKTILDKEVVYTQVITGIANAMPPGVVIEALNLSPTIFGTPTTLQVYAKTNDDALALKASFQQSPLFSNVTFQSLSNTTSGGSGYPISATLSLTINKVAR